MVVAMISPRHLDKDAEMVERKRGIPRDMTKAVLETVLEDRQEKKRLPAPEPPAGGISLRAASRKYGIANQTLSRWVKRGMVSVILRTENWLYVDEGKLGELIERYRQNPGQGKRTLIA